MKTGSVIRRLAALCLLCAILLPSFGLAASQETLSGSMGYDGIVTYLRRIPITIELSNVTTPGVLAINIARDEEQYDRYEVPVSPVLSTDSSTQSITIPVTLSYKQSSFQVEWLVDGALVAQAEVSPSEIIDPAQLLIGTLCDDQQALSYFRFPKTSDPLKRGEKWQTVPLTLDTFPGSLDSLRFFDALAIDGVDLTLLNADQQAAMDAWLRDGGIVFLGGGTQAGVGYPYFTQYTGIAAGTLALAADPTPALMSLFKMSDAPLGENVMTVELRGAANPKADGLVDVARVDNGYVFTAAFSLADKPFSTWQGRNVLWQRMLITFAQAHYQNIMTLRANGASASRYVDSSIMSSLSVKTGGAMFLPIALVALFALLVGFGAYFILKRFDKREWMWVSVPALAIACSLLLWITGNALGLREPIAVSYTVITIDEDGSSDNYTAVSAAKSEAGRMTVNAQEGTVDADNSVRYYYSSSNSADVASVPAKLRYTYSFGQPETMSFPQNTSWAENSFFLRDVPVIDCAVSGEVMWNENALSFTLQNSSISPFEPGVIITDYGFVSVPALLPGQTVSVSMTSDASKKEPEDGLLLEEAYYSNRSPYEFLNAYLRGIEDTQPKEKRAAREALCRMLVAETYNSGSDTFCYITVADQMAELKLSIDNKPVTRSAEIGGLRVALSYNPVSPDGTVRFLKGSFPTYTAEISPSGKPEQTNEVNNSRYRYFSLETTPVFAFDVSQMPEKWDVTAFDIKPAYAYYSYNTSLYNPKTGQWDLFKAYTVTNGGTSGTSTYEKLDPLAYVNDDQMIYARFEKGAVLVDYAEIGFPAFTMEGRIK